MNLVALKRNRFFDYLENIKSENLGFYFSFFLHLLILLFAIGMPNFFDPKPINIPQIIPIEIVNISESTSIPKEIKKTKISETKKMSIKEKKFNSSTNQEIKKIDINKEKKFNSSTNQEIRKIDINNEPKIINQEIEKNIVLKEQVIIEEKKETTYKLKEEIKKIDLNKIESLPTKKIKPKLKPKPSPVAKNKKITSDVIIKTKPIKVATNKEAKTDVVIKTKQQPVEDFATTLRDIRIDLSTKKIENNKETKVEKTINQTQENPSEESAKLTISEIDLLRQQLSSCWNAPAGAVIEKGMLVKISAKLKQNRKIFEKSIRIVDTNIPKSNSFYEPITESAMRTLLNPECIPLKVPLDKYDLWKDLTITFDYSIMRGY